MRRLIQALRPKKPNTDKRPSRRRQPPKWRGPAIKGGLALALVLSLGVTVGWGVRSGHVDRAWTATVDWTEAMTVVAGLRVDDVLVVGRSQTQPSDLLAALDVTRGTPILSLDLGDLRERVNALPWIATARVERRLPDTLFVEVTERRPLALWQRDGRLSLIDDAGAVILRSDLGRFATLPIIIGEGAPERAADVLSMLSSEPDLAARVAALTWIGDRRWDLRLDDDIAIQLPEQGAAKAWSELAALEREHGVLARDVHTIDLRIPDQLIVRTAPETIERGRAPGQST